MFVAVEEVVIAGVEVAITDTSRRPEVTSISSRLFSPSVTITNGNKKIKLKN